MAITTNKADSESSGPWVRRGGSGISMVSFVLPGKAQEVPSFAVVLTDEQRTAYHKLLGEPFNLSKLRFRAPLQHNVGIENRGISVGRRRPARRNSSFDPRVVRPVYASATAYTRPLRRGPPQHHTAGGSCKPFADLITSDGYQVVPNREKSPASCSARSTSGRSLHEPLEAVWLGV